MKPNEGRLQTSEHILAKILEGRLEGITVGISKFKEESGLLEIISTADLRALDLKEIESEVNNIISKGLPVNKPVMDRAEAEKVADLGKVPASVARVTIIDIEGFDKRPCRDPHASNTSEIGHFKILGVEKVGADRYRFVFLVE